MAKKKNKKSEQVWEKKKKLSRFFLPEEIKRKIAGIMVFLLALIVALSFFEKAGWVGGKIFLFLNFLIGKTVFFLPPILVLAGLVSFLTGYKKFFFAEILAIFLAILAISGFFSLFKATEGGWLGYLVTKPLFQLFGFLLSQIILAILIFISGLIFWHLLQPLSIFLEKKEKLKIEKGKIEKEKPLITRIFKKVIVGPPSFKIKEIEPSTDTFKEPIPRPNFTLKPEEPSLEVKTQPIDSVNQREYYQPPPLELLEAEREKSFAGDIRINSAIIKKTLENFEIPVEMSEVNIGPTVTQYTLKPAEGIKLSKITTLTNDLALALASHPIRIEAPIPGKPLVGIEVPNKIRAKVRLRDLIANPQFQNSPSNLTLVFGRDVSGHPFYTDLAKMPHLLVAGSTGTGKTIMLNSIILSLIYRNSPEILRFILIDPKRVEFSVYSELPHLLAPVIFDGQKAVNALKWLITEMERRFDILSINGSRDVASYNEKVLKEKKSPLFYIVLIIDELADLMAARGKEVEAGIVRLAQLARAVGIHLILATQRPSVEVITGLIKANITSRITFQVASQVDSRTVLDMAGAEKLLGLGDMLFLSAEVVKPKRIQGAYVTEKEVKKVVDWLKSKNTFPLGSINFNHLSLSEELTSQDQKELGLESENQDPLYEEAKQLVIEARKASASLLQRKLRIGYARAARLIDILEEKGVVGPGEGAKPRQVYIKTESENNQNNDWQKI